ncbi:MAG: glycosyltransferase [Gemmataceae bacterium]|nr:glycosyltransferase [Gemmataceae bacterium]
MSRAEVLVSAVAVVRDQAALLPEFLGELSKLLAAQFTHSEIVLIDNGSTDATESAVRETLRRIPGIRYLRLTRPTDEETALVAGLDAAIGDYVVCLNPDFDPPSVIPGMIDVCRSGADLVVGVDRGSTPPGGAYRFLRQRFLGLVRRFLDVDLPTGTTGCRALSRHAVNALVQVRQRRRYFLLVAADVGLVAKQYPYERISRSGAKPHTSLLRGLRIGLSLLVHNSLVPLRLISVLGLAGSFLSFLYTLYVIGIYLFKKDVLPGWTTLSLQVNGLFTLAFLMLALLGEYMGRLVEETTVRPLYHTRPEVSSAVDLSDPERRNVLGKSDDGA